MPQNPNGSYVAVGPTKKFVPLNADANGNLLITSDIGQSSALNITTETVLKATPGTVFAIIVNTGGTSAGGLYDAASIGNVGTGTLIYTIGTASLGRTALEFPFKNGLVVNPGTGQVLSISFT